MRFLTLAALLAASTDAIRHQNVELAQSEEGTEAVAESEGPWWNNLKAKINEEKNKNMKYLKHLKSAVTHGNFNAALHDVQSIGHNVVEDTKKEAQEEINAAKDKVEKAKEALEDAEAEDEAVEKVATEEASKPDPQVVVTSA